MTFPLTLLAFALATVCALFQWKRTAVASFIFALLLTFGFGAGPFTGLILRDIQQGYEDHPSPSKWPARSAIILLGMGTSNVGPGKQEEVGPLAYGRVVQAVEAYHSCKTAGGICKLIMTGGDKAKKGVTEASIYGKQLSSLGIDSSDLILESKSQSTWENAKFTRPLIDQIHADQVYLVTSGVHMRRALLYFNHFGIKATPIRSDYLMPWPTWTPMAFNFASADLAINEYRGLLRYQIYNKLGWND